MVTSPPIQGESAYEDSEWFPTYDFAGTKGFYLEGVYRIREHMMDTSRWGLTRRSPRVTRPPERLISPAHPADTNIRKRSRDDSPDTNSPSKKQKATPSPHLLPEALTLLAPPPNPSFPEYYCLQCKLPPSDPSCTTSCRATFRATHFTPTASKLQIRATSPAGQAGGKGLGVFVLPGEELPAGAWLGEYLGELLPPTAPEADSSDYAFTLSAQGGAAEVVIDAATHGNWTRFVNSSCRPNVVASPEQVGGGEDGGL